MYKVKITIKGFTLVEIMVATSIFMIIMLVVMGALVSISSGAKEAQALRTAMDNVNFTMESMTRSLRTGTDYTCVPVGSNMNMGNQTNEANDCVGGGGAIIFTPQGASSRRMTAYKVEARNDGTNDIKKCVGGSTGQYCSSVVAPNVDIKKLTFFVKGSGINDSIQPSVFIMMKGSVKVKGVDYPFAIQTLASQRTFE